MLPIDLKQWRDAGIRLNICSLAAAGLGAVLAGVLAPAALGEMAVRLKDGRTLTLPVERHQVDSITYGSRSQDETSPLRRAAQQKRGNERLNAATKTVEDAA